jgi:hypothetical protein
MMSRDSGFGMRDSQKLRSAWSLTPRVSAPVAPHFFTDIDSDGCLQPTNPESRIPNPGITQ